MNALDRGTMLQRMTVRQDIPRPSWLVETPLSVVAHGVSEAVAREIAHRWNMHADLLAALMAVILDTRTSYGLDAWEDGDWLDEIHPSETENLRAARAVAVNAKRGGAL